MATRVVAPVKIIALTAVNLPGGPPAVFAADDAGRLWAKIVTSSTPEQDVLKYPWHEVPRPEIEA